MFNPTEDLKVPDHMVRNMMSLIKLKCSIFGCGKIVPYNIFYTHIEGCSLNPDMKVKCEYCKKTYKKIDEFSHMDQCTVSLLKFIKLVTKEHFAKDSTITKGFGSITFA